MALNVGFKGIDAPDEFGVTPILSSNESRNYVERKDRLKYAYWLIKKGARLDRCTNSLGISAAHRMAVNSGKFVRYKFFQHGSYTQMPTEIVRVLLAMANNAAQSHLPCPWATEELSRPLHHFLVSSLLDIDRSRQFVRQRKPNLMARLTVTMAVYVYGLLFYISSDLDVGSQRKSIIGVLTMGALGIDHWPHRYEWTDYQRQMGPRAKVEVKWDMLDEDRILIKQLGELVEEFAQELSSKKVRFEDFLRLHWLPRIRQVQRERKALHEDRRRQLRQLGVVLDDEFAQDVYCNYDQGPDAWEDCFRNCPFEFECPFEVEDSDMVDWEVPEWE
ncbi:hypothetical protein NW767_003113 [Fusarium falciforme]|nr:hypothetical protein NW767_003113 [Fusarium falciforme]